MVGVSISRDWRHPFVPRLHWRLHCILTDWPSELSSRIGHGSWDRAARAGTPTSGHRLPRVDQVSIPYRGASRRTVSSTFASRPGDVGAIRSDRCGVPDLSASVFLIIAAAWKREGRCDLHRQRDRAQLRPLARGVQARPLLDFARAPGPAWVASSRLHLPHAHALPTFRVALRCILPRNVSGKHGYNSQLVGWEFSMRSDNLVTFNTLSMSTSWSFLGSRSGSDVCQSDGRSLEWPRFRFLRSVASALLRGRPLDRSNVAFLFRGNQQTAARSAWTALASALEAEPADFDLLRFTMPLDVIPSFVYPYTDQPGVFSLDSAIRRKMSPTSPNKIGLSVLGLPVAVSPVTNLVVAADPSTVRVVGSGTVTFGPRGACVSGPGDTALDVRLGKEVEGDDLFFQVTADSGRTAALRGVALLDDGSAGYNSNLTTIPPGEPTAVVDRLDGTRATTLRLVLEKGVEDLCVQSLWIGQVAANDGSGCQVVSHFARPTGKDADCTGTWPA